MRRGLRAAGYTLKRIEAERPQEVGRELDRLSGLPAGVPTTTGILGPVIQVPCPRTFLYLYREIWERDIYRLPDGLEEVFVLDVGANIGLASIRIKRQYPSARVTAFEADPDIAEMLRLNLAAFGLGDVKVVRAAVSGPVSADLYFLRDAGGTGGRLTTEAVGERVRTVDLRDYLSGPTTFLKVDIEGAEGGVIANVRDRLDGVELAFIEYHSFVDRRQELSAILAALEGAGMRYVLERGGVVSRQPLAGRPVYKGMDLLVNIFAWRPR
jgi:FkbM family methyltransferase